MRRSVLDPATDALTSEIIAAAIAVHRHFGAGCLERVYHISLAHELAKRGHVVESGVEVPVVYDNIEIDRGFRLDLRVDEKVIIEVKAVSAVEDVHLAQLYTYLALTGAPVGLLINFNVRYLRDGLRRVVCTLGSEGNTQTTRGS